MAPYTGDINTVDINKLQFFKIHEGGLYSDGSWATDRMIAHERTWNTTIPWDIKPGTYVVRHELLSLHFATTHSNYSYIPGGMVAPQFYPSCYSVNVTGSGSATPANRVTFPGAYQKNDPGLNFDIFAGAKEYPIPGPKVYQPTGIAPKLNPNPVRWMSPTGDGEGKDADYMKSREAELKQWEKVTDFFQAIGG
jgi:hypothetical protein